MLDNSDNELALLEIDISEKARTTLLILPKQSQLSFMKQAKKNLEEELKLLEKEHKTATENAENMQTSIKDAAKKGLSGPVIGEMFISLEKLRNIEKEKRNKVDELQNTIRQKNSSLIKSHTAIKKRYVNIILLFIFNL